jgi:hypothetical protein
MNYPHYFFNKIKSLALMLISLLMLTQCSENDELYLAPETSDTIISKSTSEATTEIASPSNCTSCTYVVPASSKTQVVDGKVLGLKPGNVICLSAQNNYSNILFKNIIGSSANPIVITNCGGTATLNATGLPYTMKTENSKYFRITGGQGIEHGINLTGGHMGLTLESLSTNFEIDHLEIHNVGFAGIMAKTNPTCDDATIRGKFIMRNTVFHNNYIHHTGGEGFYIGHSYYIKGVSTSCGIRYPHTIEGLKIYDNTIKFSGWDAIQVGCALSGASVYNNSIENYGASNTIYQNNAIQFSEGTKGICHGNYIKNGSGTGICAVGYGDAFLYNNIIINAGEFGIFCDERTSPGAGIKIINNTIITPKNDGIRLYTDLVPMNTVVNNIVVNPGSYSSYTYPRTGNDAYLYTLNKSLKIQQSNNYFTLNINSVKFISPTTFNYRINNTSPALNKGKDITVYNIPKDFYKQNRLKGAAYDIGASEY